MRRAIFNLGITLVAGMMVAACGAGSLDYDEDFTKEVEQICADYCDVNLACREPAWFESDEACVHSCLHSAFIYNDTDCGEAKRAVVACVGSQPTCELYDDTLNVHAEVYTCQAETEHRAKLSEACGQSDENPYPNGKP